MVGIRPSQNPEYSGLLTNFSGATSGLYLDDVEHFKVESWVKCQDYAAAGSGALNAKMGQIQLSAISSVVHQVFTIPSYTDRNRLFSQTYDTNETETQDPDTSRFFGYEIKISDRKNVAFKITKLILEMQRSDDAEIEIFLFHSSLIVPLMSQVITIESQSDDIVSVVDVDWTIDAVDLPYKGSFFIGYFRPTNTLKPWKRDFENASCMNSFSELSIRRMTIKPNFRNLDSIEYVSEHNGLNFDLTVYDDYTDLVLQNKFLFARAIQLNWAMMCITEYMNSLRSNREQRMSTDHSNLLLAIEGQRGLGVQRVVGLREQFAGQISDLKTEIQRIREGYQGQDNGLIMDTLC